MLTAFVAQAILAETSLSFLGLGVQEPTAAWGLMLSGNAADFYPSGAVYDFVPVRCRQHCSIRLQFVRRQLA
jgi:ABC-type dipeptide/oligopeptide/nickel transport system permease subunit